MEKINEENSNSHKKNKIQSSIELQFKQRNLVIIALGVTLFVGSIIEYVISKQNNTDTNCITALFGLYLFVLFCLKKHLGLLEFKRKKLRKLHYDQLLKLIIQEYKNYGYYPTYFSYKEILLLSNSKEKIILKLKHNNCLVTNDTVNEVLAQMRYYKANKGMIVTSSLFTKEALNLAKSNNFTLWDCNILTNFLDSKIKY